MMLSVKEVNFYNSLVDSGLANKINCPFDEPGVADHIVITKVDKNDLVIFKCITCDTKFEPGMNTIEIIQSTVNKYKF